MTRGHGRHLGLVRGGRSVGCGRCCSPAISSRRHGARVLRIISAPLPVEPLASRAALFPRPRRRAAWRRRRSPRCCVSCRSAIRMRDLFEMADVIAALSATRAGRRRAADGPLRACRCWRRLASDSISPPARSPVAGGSAYVSPKSGRAVSRDAGAPWGPRLLAYPRFLQEEIEPRRSRRLSRRSG